MSHWSAPLIKAFGTKEQVQETKEQKYHNVKEEYAGYSFQSGLERAVFQDLCLRLKAGDFDKISVQQTVYLTQAQIKYIADFKCEKDSGDYFYVEAKGYEGARWNIIRKLWKYYGPATLEIWKGTAKTHFLSETIIPKTEGLV